MPLAHPTSNLAAHLRRCPEPRGISAGAPRPGERTNQSRASGQRARETAHTRRTRLSSSWDCQYDRQNAKLPVDTRDKEKARHRESATRSKAPGAWPARPSAQVGGDALSLAQHHRVGITPTDTRRQPPARCRRPPLKRSDGTLQTGQCTGQKKPCSRVGTCNVSGRSPQTSHEAERRRVSKHSRLLTRDLLTQGKTTTGRQLPLNRARSSSNHHSTHE